MAVTATAPMAQAPMAQAKQFEKTNPILISPQTCSGGKKMQNKANFKMDNLL
jgi:hypothetical protein